MKNDNKNILDNPIISWFIFALIIYSTLCFTVETMPDLSIGTQTFLKYSEMVVVFLFTLEYLYRIYTAENKLKFIFSFYGLIDLFAILPFYLATAIDLRSFRVIRLLRLLKLARYNQVLQRFSKAIFMVKEELIIFTFTSFIIIYMAAVGIYHFEHQAQPEAFKSIFDCMWWAVATLTTVGYGDVYPITFAGRLFTFIILMIGLGMVAVPTGILASALSQLRQDQLEIDNKKAANSKKSNKKSKNKRKKKPQSL